MRVPLLTQALRAILADSFYIKSIKKGILFNVQEPVISKLNDTIGPLKVGSVKMRNRIVMAPMTRCRAINNIPNDLMAKYYMQRSAAGLIVSEGTSPSPNGLGYARIPGIFSKEQIDAWKKITSAVHRGNGIIFLQIMHTGRMSHILNMPRGAEILAPSAVKATGQMWTDAKKMQDFQVPKVMSIIELKHTKTEYANAAINAKKARFDGVEIHAANGYLLEQFISPMSNLRTDNYGGSIIKRCRFVLEVVSAVAEAIGKDKTGIRLSPYGTEGDMPVYNQIDATYQYLAEQLNRIGIAYIHIVDHSSMGSPAVPFQLKKSIRTIFKNTIILSGGYDKNKAESDIESGLADMIAFGRPYINNPDLIERFKNNWALSSDLKSDLFYSSDEKGYVDYPVYKMD
jgi:N-ethylmaleimide reductase